MASDLDARLARSGPAAIQARAAAQAADAGSVVVAAGQGIAERAERVARPSAVGRAADIAAAHNAADREAPVSRINPGRVGRVGHGGASASAVARVGTRAEAIHVATRTGRSDPDEAARQEAVRSIGAGHPTGSGTDPGRGRRSAGSGPIPPDRPVTVAATRLHLAAASASDHGTVPRHPGQADSAAAPIARTRAGPAGVRDLADRAALVSRAPDSGPPSRGSSPVDPSTANRPTMPATIDPVDSAATSRRRSRTTTNAGPAAVRRSDRDPDARHSIAPVHRTAVRRGQDALRSATDPVPIARGGMPRPGHRTRIDRGSPHRTC
jgi:hypothetical protein